MSEQHGQSDWAGRPGPYQAPGGFGAGAGAGSPSAPSTRPRQVTAASAIAFVLGGLSVLLSAAVLLTEAGPEISETLTGADDAVGVIGFAALLSAAMYLVPAVFVLQRKSWARIMMLVVAGIGIAGGVSALPGGILGLALHSVLLAMMLQRPTRAWFGTGARR
jgi:hypothetical protein